MAGAADAGAVEPIPAGVRWGSLGFGLAAAAGVALSLPFELPTGPGVAGWSAFYRWPAPTQVRSFVVLGALAPALAAAAMLAWLRLPRGWRRAAAPAWAALLAPVVLLPPFAAGSHAAAGLGVALATAVVLTLLGRGLVRPRPLVLRGLAALAPLALLAAVPATRVRFVDGGTVAGGYDLPWARALLVAAATAGALGAALVAPRLGWRRVRALLVWFGLPALAAGLSFRYRVHATDIDGLHEGEPLASAAALDAGGAPYRDVVFFHGLGEDPGRARLAFRLFGRSVRGLRVLRDVLEPLAAAAFALVAAAGLKARWALALVAGALAGFVPVPFASRSLLSDLALALLLLVARRPAAGRAAAAGLVAAAAALWGLDTGLAVLLAGGIGLGLLGLRPGGERRAALGFAAGAGSVLGGFVLWLAARGLVGDFVRLAGLVGGDFGLAFSRAFEFSLAGWREAGCSIVAPAALAAGGLAVAAGALRGGRGVPFRILLLLWLDAMAQFGRAVDRADPAHIEGAARIAWPLLFALLSAWRPGERALAGLLAGLLWLPGAPHPALPALASEVARRGQVDITGRSLLDHPRVGVLLSGDAARRLSALLAVLDRLPAGATFYDFTNHGSLYFLTGRALPTRFTQVWLAPGVSAQREIVADLEHVRPAVVLFRSSTSYDALDHIDNRLRHWAVAEYLVARHRPRGAAGGFLLLAPGEAMTTPPPEGAVFDVLRAGSIPALWGHGETPAGATALALEPIASGRLRLPDLAARRAGTAAVRVEIESPTECPARLVWRAAAGGVRTGEIGVAFDVLPGRRSYLLPLAILPAWVWPEAIDDPELEIDTPRAVVHRAAAVPGPLLALAGQDARR